MIRATKVLKGGLQDVADGLGVGYSPDLRIFAVHLFFLQGPPNRKLPPGWL